MGVIQTYLCTAKLRDKNDKIIAYNLRNISTNQQQRVEPATLKQFIRSGNVNILNLQLTSDGRLIDREMENPDKIIRDENYDKLINIIISKYSKQKYSMRHVESILRNPYKKYTLIQIPIYNTFFDKAALYIVGTANPNEFIIRFQTESMETDYSKEKQDWEASKLIIDKQIKSKIPSMELETLLNRIESTFVENKGNVQAAVDCLGLCLVNSSDEVPFLKQQKEISILCDCYGITKKDLYGELVARYNNYYKQQSYKDTAVVLAKAIKQSLGGNAKYFSDRDIYDAYIAYLAITSNSEKSSKLSKIVKEVMCKASVLWSDTEISKYRVKPETTETNSKTIIAEETKRVEVQKSNTPSSFVNFALGSHAKPKTSENKSRNGLLRNLLNK